MWQNHPSVNSLLHLSEFINYRIDFNELPIKIAHFSQRHTEKFLHWLAQDEISEKLKQYFFYNLDESSADKIATIDILDCVFSK